MHYKLTDLDQQLKRLLSLAIIVLTIGVTVGLYFVHLNTQSSVKGITSHYQGNEQSADEFELKYAKSLKELVLTVHNHVITFTFIFLVLGLIFYGVQTIHPGLKQFLLVEPFISILLTFGSMFLIRFVSESFVYLMILSSTILYLSFYIMVFYSLRELKN